MRLLNALGILGMAVAIIILGVMALVIAGVLPGPS